MQTWTESNCVCAGTFRRAAALPALRELTIRRFPAGAQAGLWASVQPYLSTLDSLVISAQPVAARDDNRQPLWCSLFTAPSASSLTWLTLPCYLDPWLAALLQQSALALEELTVPGVKASVRHADRVASACPWHTLRLTVVHDVPARAFQWLPTPANGKLTVAMCDKTPESIGFIHLRLPLSDKVSEKAM